MSTPETEFNDYINSLLSEIDDVFNQNEISEKLSEYQLFLKCRECQISADKYIHNKYHLEKPIFVQGDLSNSYNTSVNLRLQTILSQRYSEFLNRYSKEFQQDLEL